MFSVPELPKQPRCLPQPEIRLTMTKIAFCSSLILALIGSFGTQASLFAAPLPHEKTVSYISGIVLDGDYRCASSGCEWHIYQPATRQDLFFLKLPRIPEDIFWDQNFENVYYRIKESIYELQWKLGAHPRELSRIPPGIGWTVSEIWIDSSTSRLRFSNFVFLPDRNVVRTTENGQEKVYFVYEGARLDATRSANWGTPAVVTIYESPIGSEDWEVLKRLPDCGETNACGFAMREFLQKEPQSSVSLRDVLESMRIGYRLHDSEIAAQEGEVVYLPSKSVSGRGLKMTIVYGDTEHGNPPLIYASEDGMIDRIIISKGPDSWCCDFEEHGHLVLLGGEYRMQNAKLIDMRSGNIVYEFPQGSRYAVWTAPLNPR